MDVEIDIRGFLEQFSLSDLKDRRVLSPRSDNRLDGKISAQPLLALMREHSVTRLMSKESGWYLDAGGNWENPISESRTGFKKGDLGQVRALFHNQNRLINPFFNKRPASG